MSKFAIGQRVKVIRDSSGYTPEVVGVETTIAGEQRYYPCGWYNLLKMGYLIDFRPPWPWKYYCIAEHDMVPLAPDGMETDEEITELYEPEPELVEVMK